MFGTATLGEQQVGIQLEPSRTDVYPVRVRVGDTAHVVYQVSPGGLDFTAEMDGGDWTVQNERDSFRIRWRVVQGFSVPMLLVHLTAGEEHTFDIRHLYTWTEAHGLVEAWKGTTIPRYVARKELGLHTLKGEPTWVEAASMRLAEPGLEDPDQYSLETFRYDPSTGALAAVEVPVYAAIAGTYRSLDEGLAARTGCAESALVVSTDAWPKLKSGLFVLAWFSPIRADADAALANAKSCRPDAYLKRAR